MQLKNQFSAIIQSFESDDGKEKSPGIINLTNKIYKNINNDLMAQLLNNAGFKKESNNKFIILEGDLEKIRNAYSIINEYQKN